MSTPPKSGLGDAQIPGSDSLGRDSKRKLKELRSQKALFLDSFVAMATGENQSIYVLDFWMLAVVNRSVSTIDAFCDLTKKQNYLSAFSMVRLHLDTLLRLYATTLVDDCNGLVLKLMDEQLLRKEKDRTGNPMNDAYLVKKLSEDFGLDWVAPVYSKTSGFIHLSKTHIYSPMKEFDDENWSMNIMISERAKYRPDLEIEAIDCMSHISKLLLQMLKEWSSEKPTLKPTKSLGE